jgi:predicted nucleotide-binding protein
MGWGRIRILDLRSSLTPPLRVLFGLSVNYSISQKAYLRTPLFASLVQRIVYGKINILLGDFMADLTRRDKSILERHLQMEGGHLLNFSHRTLGDFFEGFDIDIYNEAYVRDLSSGSKANKMRGFWTISDNETVGKVLLSLIEIYDEDRESNGHKNNPYSYTSTFNDSNREKSLDIVNNLIAGTPSTTQSPQQHTITQAGLIAEQPHLNAQPTAQQAQDKELMQLTINAQSNHEPNYMNQHQTTDKQKVFIVHGHDDILRLRVENFVRRLGLEPVILMDKANGGNTIIEKLIKNGAVAYAIILYTPCDEGRKVKNTDLKARARQNVIFEHGYFIARLGRDKVAAIVEPSVEIQNDIQGVVYIGTNENWEMKLSQELKAANIEFDANALYT